MKYARVLLICPGLPWWRQSGTFQFRENMLMLFSAACFRSSGVRLLRAYGNAMTSDISDKVFSITGLSWLHNVFEDYLFLGMFCGEVIFADGTERRTTADRWMSL